MNLGVEHIEQEKDLLEAQEKEMKKLQKKLELERKKELKKLKLQQEDDLALEAEAKLRKVLYEMDQKWAENAVKEYEMHRKFLEEDKNHFGVGILRSNLFEDDMDAHILDVKFDTDFLGYFNDEF